MPECFCRCRAAKQSDLAAIVENNAAHAAEIGEQWDANAGQSGAKSALNNPETYGQYFVAVDGAGEIQGQVLVIKSWSDWHAGWHWQLTSVYVHPERRRQGIATALVNHVLRLAACQEDVVSVGLLVQHQNKSAQRIYDRAGFHMTGYQFMEWSRFL